MATTNKHWGFDAKNIDISVRPQDDFYHYANGSWIKKTKIPPEEAKTGSFYELRVKTDNQLKVLVDTLLKNKHTKGSPEQLVSDYYRSAFDMKRRNSLGIRAIADIQKRIDAIELPSDIVPTIAYLHKLGVSGGWNCFIDQDMKDSNTYLLYVWQGGLSLPDRDYYLLDAPEQVRVREAYKKYIEKLSTLAGFTSSGARHTRDVVMALETRLAKASMLKEKLRDPDHIYHIYKPSKLWQEYFTLLGASNVKRVNVAQPVFIAEVEAMLKEVPVEDWKMYLTWHLLNDYAGSLSEPFIKASFDFYSKTIRGVQKMKPLWRRALTSTNGALGEPMGKLYTAEFFPKSAKKKIDTLVSDLFVVFEHRIQKLDWMTSVTKKKAIIKLRAMKRKIAYPTKWDLYKGVEIDPSDYIGNIHRVYAHTHKKMLRKLQKPVDRTEWITTPQTVNAFYNGSLNDINFPAAILQWPFFDPTADDALNYACIGGVIGHEMTHGFDNSGAKFNEKGNLHNWWTPTDKKKFEQKGKLLIQQANAHTIFPGITLNGKLTLGENIADLGGLVIAFDAYQKHLAKTGRKIVGGLSPEMRFFLAYAQMEREVSRPETLKMYALVDDHANAVFRLNGPFSNFEPFYETYGVKKGDKLYREPNKRAKIW